MQVKLTAITPKGDIINVAKQRAALLQAVDSITHTMQGDFRQTTKTWNAQPIFRIVKAQMIGANIEGAVGTDNEIYGYVTRGTRPHIIRPIRAKALRFQTGYRAKTRVGSLSSRRGGTTGNVAFAQLVHHPGTEARGFEELIIRRRQRQFERETAQAITKALGGNV